MTVRPCTREISDAPTLIQNLKNDPVSIVEGARLKFPWTRIGFRHIDGICTEDSGGVTCSQIGFYPTMSEISVVNSVYRGGAITHALRITILFLYSLRVDNWHTSMWNSVADPGCLSLIPDPDFYPYWILDPKPATKERGEKIVVIPYLEP